LIPMRRRGTTDSIVSLPPPTDVTSLEGRVEVSSDGQLVLQIPLAAGGDRLALYAKDVGEIDGEFLIVVNQAVARREAARRGWQHRLCRQRERQVHDHEKRRKRPGLARGG
jgi:hypothetical protein